MRGFSLVGYRRHLDGRLWCGIMALMNALSKGSRFANRWGSIMPFIWPMPLGTREVPNSSFFMAFSSLYLGLLAEDNVPGELFYLPCPAFPRATYAIEMAPRWWATIASMKASSEYLPFFRTICLAIPPEPIPVEP